MSVHRKIQCKRAVTLVFRNGTGLSKGYDARFFVVC